MKKRLLAILMCLALCVGLLPLAASADGYVAEVELRYSTYDIQLQQRYYKTFSTNQYTSLQAAFTAAEQADYEDQVTLGENEQFSYYSTSIVRLLQNAEISSEVTLGVGIDLDLNGKTLNVTENGAITGSGSFTIDSVTPGVFNSAGRIQISSFGTWTGDTTNITSGSIPAMFGVDGGTINLTGGAIELAMINNGGDAPIDATISEDAHIVNVHENGSFVIYSPTSGSWQGIHLTLSGGYYDNDPRLFYMVSDGAGGFAERYQSVSEVVSGFTYYRSEDGTTFEQITNNAQIDPDDVENNRIYICYSDFVTLNGEVEATNEQPYSYRIVSGAPVTPTAAVATAPTANSLTYTGAAQALVTAGTAANGAMQYALGENATAAPTSGWSASIPMGTAAGTYYVWYKAAGNFGYADSTPQVIAAGISKAAPAVTAPTVKTNLSYTGQEQALINAGTGSGGSFLYALGESASAAPVSFGSSIPSGTDAGSYYVWYGVEGDANHDSIAPTFVGEAVIAPVTVTVTALDRSILVGGTLPDLSSPAQGADYKVTGLAGGDALGGTVEMKYTKYDDLTYVLTPDTDAAGTYRIVIEGAAAPDGGNYDSAVSFVNGTLTVSEPYVDDGGSEKEPAVTTETATQTLADGSTVETKTETKTETKEDGSTVETTTVTETTTGTDGSKVESTSETAVTTRTDGEGVTMTAVSAIETVVATDADGAQTTTETTVEASETLDADGNGTVERTTTEKVTDAEGNVVTTVTESKGTIETDENGTKTTTIENTVTTTDAEGNVTTKTTTEQTGETADGSVGTTVKDSAGRLLSAELKLSDAAVEKARETGKPIAAPMNVPTADAEDAEPVWIDMPALTDGDSQALSVPDMPRVEIPVSVSGPGVIAMMENAEGDFVPVKECYEGSVIVPVSGSCKLVIVDNTKAYSDVAADSWYYDAVTFVTAREIFNGMDGGVFAPGGFMTRGMMAQVLYNFDREAAASGLTLFADAAGKWYADAASWANSVKIVEGTDLGFEGEVTIPREQVATMLYRYAKYLGLDVSGEASLDAFPDGGETADWAVDAMRWAVGVGLFRGNDDGALNPKGTATRAEIATLMERMVKVIMK